MSEVPRRTKSQDRTVLRTNSAISPPSPERRGGQGGEDRKGEGTLKNFQLSRCGGWCRPGVYQAFRDRLDAQVEPFERTGAEQDEIAGLPEDEVVGRPLARDVDKGRADPSFDDGPVGLPKTPSGEALDSERLQDGGGHPRQLCTRVDEDGRQRPPLAGAGGVFDLDIDAECSHVVGHDSSSGGVEWYHYNASGIQTTG